MGAEDRTTTHVPALDGLRAVAVVAVVGYHYGVAGFSGGFLGVDLFFVLSGYLITSLLLREHAADGSIDLLGFWARRIRRLLPASTVMLAAVAVWGWTQVPAHQLGRLRHDLLTTVGYVANWGFISSGQSYFDASVEPSPLRHVWSLAIEEQFYALWPIIVVVLLRLGRGRRWPIIAVVVGAIVASSATMWVLFEPADPSRSYYGTDTRAGQLLIGALLAVLVASRAGASRGGVVPRARTFAGAAALLVVVLCFVMVDDSSAGLYRGGFVAFATVVAALVWSVGRGTSPLARMLSWRPLTATGEISYGLYLWHWPVQIAVSESRTPLTGWQLTAARLLLTVLLAVASHRLVETPVRRREGWGRLRTWRLPLAAAAAVGAATSLAVVSTTGAVDVPRYLAGDVGEIAVSGPVGTDSAVPVDRRVVLIGDSVALSLEEAMAAEATERGWSLSMVTRWSCAITDMAPPGHGCTQGRPEFLSRVAEAHAPIILWYSNWDGPLNFYDAFDGTTGPAGSLTNSFAFLRLLDDTVQPLVESGARVDFVLGPALSPPGNSPAWDANIEAARDVYRAYHALKPEHTSLLDLASAACAPGPPCPRVVDGVELRPVDGVHFGEDGARWVARWIFDRLEERATAR